MSTFTFEVTKGSSRYLTTIERTTQLKAFKAIEEMEPKGASIVFVGSLPGTMNDYLGPDAVARISAKKSEYRRLEEQKKLQNDRARRRVHGE